MRNILVLGCLFTFVLTGCAQRPASVDAAVPTSPVRAPKEVSTPIVDVIKNPPPCWEAELIYHTRFKQMLLVNCVADPGKLRLLTLWSWDGARWQKLTEDGPPGRILGGAAYDDLRDVLVLYGGRPVEMGGCSQETWEWDGEFWEQIDAQPPTACDHVKMVYDKSRQKSILFSGLDSAENLVNETWSWNGMQWKLLNQEGPESRGHFGFVYDPMHKQTILYGGYTSTVSDEFWMWKDGVWQKQNGPGPGALSHFGMTWNKDENALYIFGGSNSSSTFSSLTDKTWVLRDGQWEELHPVISPSRRGGPALGYDPVRKRVILYGGFDSAQNYLSDTWEWDGGTWTCMENCD
jgi:hypothetical protein